MGKVEIIYEVDEADLAQAQDLAELLPYGADGGVYFVKVQDYVKIGYSRSVNTRLLWIMAGMPFQATPSAFIPCQHAAHAQSVETAIYRLFDSVRVRGEWFRWCDSIARYVAEHAQSWPPRIQRLDDGLGAGRRAANAKRTRA